MNTATLTSSSVCLIACDELYQVLSANVTHTEAEFTVMSDSWKKQYTKTPVNTCATN